MPDRPVVQSAPVAVEAITKDFPSTRALDRVSIAFRRGQVHGLIGENGAGKSTLMKILAGIEQPTSGMVLVRGDEAVLHDPWHAQAAGIAMIHQELNLVDELTVADNIYLGRELTSGPFLDERGMRTGAEDLLRSIGAHVPVGRKVRELPLAQQQMVEIAKALSQKASVLIMDEPTAVLTPHETRLLFRLIRKLKGQGVTVIFISHHLDEVIDLCDEVTVMRDGRVVRTMTVDEEVTEDMLAKLMVGRELSQQFPKRNETSEQFRLRVTGVQVAGCGHKVSFTTYRGEILGFAGLVGAGRTELAEALVGLREASGGLISLDGQQAYITDYAAALKQGIAYLSEDRRGRGLVMGTDVRSNVTLPSLEKFTIGPLLNVWKEAAAVRTHVDAMGIRTESIYQPIATLSGGNQQKVAIARWLEMDPKVLILDEPTRGVDIGAKAEIYRLIHGLAAEGMSCIVISSEMNELLGLCHRIAVMRRGRLVDILEAPKATEEQIMRLAAGVGENGEERDDEQDGEDPEDRKDAST